MNNKSVVPSTRAGVWIALAGAGAAIIASLLNPLLGQSVHQQLLNFLTETVKYILFATSFFVLFWVFLKGPMQKRKLSRKAWPKKSQVFREGLFSVCTQVIFITVDLWVAYTVPWSAKNSYTDIASYGWLYYAFTIFLAFFIHDTYFYWMHRIAHHPRIYNIVHRVHHESTDPTPYSAFHFHPLEALLEGGASVAMLALFATMPWHYSLPIIWAYGQITLNVIGHLGYEIYPSWWNRIPFLKMKTTGMHHYLHHQMVRGNYSLYFRWWDILCGTEFPDYERRYDALFSKGRKVNGDTAHSEPAIG